MRTAQKGMAIGKQGKERPRNGMVSALVGNRSYDIMKKADKDREKDGEETKEGFDVWTCLWQSA